MSTLSTKTLTGSVNVPATTGAFRATSNQLVFGTNPNTTLNVNTPAVSRTYTILDNGSNGNIVITDTNGNIIVNNIATNSIGPNGIGAFSISTANGNITINSGQGKVILGGTNGITCNNPLTLDSVISGTTNKIALVATGGAQGVLIYPPAAANMSIAIGKSSTDVSCEVGVANVDGAYFGNTSANDIVFRNNNTSANIHFGFGSSNSVMYATPSGLKFTNATTSYVPAPLSYYEERTTFSLTMIGPWTGTNTFNFVAARTGKQVTIMWVQQSFAASGTAAVIQNSIQSVPARFRPVETYDFAANTISNSVQVGGRVGMDSTGSIVFYSSPAGGTFANTNNAGIMGGTATFWIA